MEGPRRLLLQESACMGLCVRCSLLLAAPGAIAWGCCAWSLDARNLCPATWLLLCPSAAHHSGLLVFSDRVSRSCREGGFGGRL